MTIAASLAFGQASKTTPPAAPPVKPAGNANASAEAQQMMALNQQEKAALTAINQSTQTPAQKHAARQQARLQFRRQRLALRQKYHPNLRLSPASAKPAAAPVTTPAK